MGTCLSRRSSKFTKTSTAKTPCNRSRKPWQNTSGAVSCSSRLSLVLSHRCIAGHRYPTHHGTGISPSQSDAKWCYLSFRHLQAALERDECKEVIVGGKCYIQWQEYADSTVQGKSQAMTISGKKHISPAAAEAIRGITWDPHHRFAQPSATPGHHI